MIQRTSDSTHQTQRIRQRVQTVHVRCLVTHARAILILQSWPSQLGVALIAALAVAILCTLGRRGG
eukprot:14171778-Alexandrium_andersonii.AAC.1